MMSNLREGRFPQTFASIIDTRCPASCSYACAYQILERGMFVCKF